MFFDHLSIGGIISIVAFFQKKDKRIDSWKFSFSVTIFVCMYEKIDMRWQDANVGKMDVNTVSVA